MIKAVVVANEEAEAKCLADRWNECFAGRGAFEYMPLTRDIIGDIRGKSVDLLVTVDLAGFDRSTFTDGVAYNLLDCKQVHLLLHRELENEKYLAKPLSIAMFFGCVGEAYGEYLLQKYPTLPWLKVLDNKYEAQIDNNHEKETVRLIEEVLKECRLR